MNDLLEATRSILKVGDGRGFVVNAVYYERSFVTAGGLISYGSDYLDQCVGCLGQKASSSRTTGGRISSEPQVVTAQLVDGPAAHQLHIAFDFGSEIFKRPFNAGLTRGR
jgi:hypothetical protein